MKYPSPKPPPPVPPPAVLILHTSSGLRPPDHAYASKLADEGYVCLVPDFFSSYGLQEGNRRQTFTTYAQSIHADFVGAIDMLKKMQGVQANRVGAVGFSNGGYWAFVLGGNGQIKQG